MLAEITTAQRTLLLEFYFVSSGTVMDRFIQALLEAVIRGVKVYLLIDAFGSRQFHDRDRERLRDGGVALALYNPLSLKKWNRNFARDHRKMLVVDNRVAFIGGTGLTDEFIPDNGREPAWHEVMVKVEGPVVSDWIKLFGQLWRFCTAQNLPELPCNAEMGDALMKVSTTEGIHQQEIKANFRRRIHRAKERVWLVTAYFLPSLSIRRALRLAGQRGVDVRLLLPGPITDHPGIYYASRRYYMQLLRNGVRIFEYQPRFLHAKIGVCDQWVSIGSCNLDHWNLRWNLEANQEVEEPGFTRQVCDTIASDFELCREITLEAWLERPWYRRALEFVWGFVNAIILRMV
jgi:phosphatidylserine/phosphatidylglycerophosphate/cardiolipin synthase-like enzyme